MMNQKTDQKTIDEEKALVAKLTGVQNLDDIVVNDIGWTSRVYIIENGKYVVKFPRSEQVKKEYQREIATLNLLNKTDINLRIPKICWTHPDTDYLGYEGIVGTAYDTVADATSPATKQEIGKGLGKFLKQFHALRLPEALTMTVADEIAEFQEKYQIGIAVVRGRFSESEQRHLEKLVHHTMPERLAALGEDPVLCHGDLGYWNMVLGPDQKIGIIDFGDAGYYDRSKDFIGLSDSETLEAALKVYGDSKVLRDKVAIRQKILSILDLPFYIGKGDTAGLNRTVERIRLMLNARI